MITIALVSYGVLTLLTLVAICASAGRPLPQFIAASLAPGETELTFSDRQTSPYAFVKSRAVAAKYSPVFNDAKLAGDRLFEA